MYANCVIEASGLLRRRSIFKSWKPVIPQALSQVQYALLCPVSLTSDIVNMISQGGKKVGAMYGVMVVWPPYWPPAGRCFGPWAANGSKLNIHKYRHVTPRQKRNLMLDIYTVIFNPQNDFQPGQNCLGVTKGVTMGKKGHFRRWCSNNNLISSLISACSHLNYLYQVNKFDQRRLQHVLVHLFCFLPYLVVEKAEEGVKIGCF